MRYAAGGPAEGLRLMLRGYAAAGHQAEIATLDPPGTDFQQVPTTVHALGRKTFGYGYSPALARFLRTDAHRFHGIVVHGLWQYHGLATLQEVRGKHPYAVFPHGMLDPWFNRTYPRKRLKKLPYWMLVERRLLAGADAVLFTSEVEARLAPTSFPGAHWRPKVVPYGTMGPPGDAAEERRAFQERVPELKERPFLLFAGRMHVKKGCDLLLNAYAEVLRTADLPCLLMAGPDETGISADLKAQVARLRLQDRVLWPGMLTGAAKWGAFRSADAFVLPSHQENFGIAVAEALSCGTPALISDQVNIHQEISDNGAGLVEPDTQEGTTRLLQRWAGMTEAERTQMGVRAEQCWRKCFNSAGTARAIVELFQERSREPGRSRVAGSAPGEPENEPVAQPPLTER